MSAPPTQPLFPSEPSSPPTPVPTATDPSEPGTLTDGLKSFLSIVPGIGPVLLGGPAESPPAPVGEEMETDKSSPAAAEVDTLATVMSVRDSIAQLHDTDPETGEEKWHKLFPQVGEDDVLIQDYRCALQREILIQGRLFVSERHLAFRANLLGWETSVVIPWAEVSSIEKKMTAMIIPNGIQVTTSSGSTYGFASLISRDAAYDLLTSVWHHTESNSGSESAQLLPPSKSEQGDDSSAVSYKDDEGRSRKFRFKTLASSIKSSIRSRSGSVSHSGTPSPVANRGSGLTDSQKIARDTKSEVVEWDGEEYKNEAGEFELRTDPKTSLEIMYKDLEFLKPFLEGTEEVKELNIGEWNDEGGQQSRDMTYIKPLHASIGPKETLCQIVDSIRTSSALDEDTVSVATTIHTPDVPSGSQFFVKTMTVFSKMEGGGTKVRITTEVEWIKVNRWLKGIIEKSCLDGQRQSSREVQEALETYISSHASTLTLSTASPSLKRKTTIKKTSSTPSLLSTPMLALVVVACILLLTNAITLLSLNRHRQSAQLAHIGSPEGVAARVGDVLREFELAHGLERGGKGEMERRVERVERGLEEARKIQRMGRE